MRKYTKGPWQVHQIKAQVCEASGSPICGLLWPTDERSEDETRANALLIAAAPDQNEALLAFDKWWRLPNAERTIEAIEPAMRLALAAISKAEGRKKG
jgi:hypothetical protein